MYQCREKCSEGREYHSPVNISPISGVRNDSVVRPLWEYVSYKWLPIVGQTMSLLFLWSCFDCSILFFVKQYYISIFLPNQPTKQPNNQPTNQPTDQPTN